MTHCREADDLLTLQRRAAPCQLDLQIVDAVNDDASAASGRLAEFGELFAGRLLFRGRKPLEIIFPDTRHQLCQRQSAVADRRIEIIQRFAVRLPQILPDNAFELLLRHDNMHPLALVLDARFACDDILRPPLPLEP